MDIRGVNRIKSFLGLGTDSQRSKISQSSEQRGGQNQKNKDHPPQLNMSDEQIDQAFVVLLSSLEGSGLTAERQLINSELFFVVLSPEGSVVRKLGIREINELYFKRKMDPQPGSILKRSA